MYKQFKKWIRAINQHHSEAEKTKKEKEEENTIKNTITVNLTNNKADQIST